MMLTRRTLTACISFLILCYSAYAAISPSQLTTKLSTTSDPPLNTTFITLSIDKLLIGSPPRPCCSIRKGPACEICVYTCKFLVCDVSKPWIVFIDHIFDCSIETIGRRMKIPLLKPLSAPQIEVQMSIFTQQNDQLVSGKAPLHVENLEHDPESRILKLNIEDRYDVSLNVSMSCFEGFVGPYCNISCTPPKIGEHHRCTHAGKFCESGYMGADCNVPICTYGCVKGKCVGPNVCNCDAGWVGKRCEQCKPTQDCKNPYYDVNAKKCRCYNPGFNKGGLPLNDDLERVDREYSRQLGVNNSTYLTLSVLIIILLVICALLLLVVVCLTLRNSNLNLPCFGYTKRKTQPLNSGHLGQTASGQRI